MLVAMIVPTGINASIGGHSGDATSAAYLLAACCDDLIIHPNVVNASDFTEQPDNSLYVEGSLLDTFLNGDIRLKKVKQNHILVACNEASEVTINCVNAMRSLLGISAEIVVLNTPLLMYGRIDNDNNRATGSIVGVEELVDQVDQYDYDALAVHTPVLVAKEEAEHYVKFGGINPWGGVEAKLSKEIYWRTGKPNAHAPVEGHVAYETGVTDPRLAPEMLCAAHLGCVLRGLHKAPRPTLSAGLDTYGWEDVDALVSPCCWGAPHKTCEDKGIPIMFVAENHTSKHAEFDAEIKRMNLKRNIFVRSYMEAAGALVSMRMGRSLDSHRRPLLGVNIS